MPIVHLLNELGNLRAMRIHPLHVERLILRLAVTGDRHHIAQRNRMLARVEVRRDSRVGKNSATVNGVNVCGSTGNASSPMSFEMLRAIASRNDS